MNYDHAIESGFASWNSPKVSEAASSGARAQRQWGRRVL